MTSRPALAILLFMPISLLAGCSTFRSPAQLFSAAPWKPAAEAEEAPSEDFKKAADALKNPKQTLLAYAMHLEDQQNYSEARRQYSEYLKAYPESVEASLGLARVERAAGRLTQAQEQLQTLAVAHPSRQDVILELGRLYAGIENYPQAIATLQQASALDPENELVRYELGILLTRTGRVEEGREHLAFSVGDSAAAYNIAYIMSERGETETAARWLLQASRLHPTPQTRARIDQLFADITPDNAPMATPAANPPEMQLASGPRSSGGLTITPGQSAQTAPDETRAMVSAAPTVTRPAAQAATVGRVSYSNPHSPQTASSPTPGRLPVNHPAVTRDTNTATPVSWKTSSRGPSNTASDLHPAGVQSSPPQWRGPGARPQPQPSEATAMPGTSPQYPQELPSWRRSQR